MKEMQVYIASDCHGLLHSLMKLDLDKGKLATSGEVPSDYLQSVGMDLLRAAELITTVTTVTAIEEHRSEVCYTKLLEESRQYAQEV